MSNDYGLRVGTAIRAVARLHSDTSRLLLDCDGTIGQGRTSIFKNYATSDLTWNVKANHWMAAGVYRYYDTSDIQARTVEGLTVCFIGEQDFIEEPLLIVGRIEYLDDPMGKQGCEEWDLWYAYFKASPKPTLGSVSTLQHHAPQRIKGIDLIAVHLFSITSIEDLIGLMQRLRSTQHPAVPEAEIEPRGQT